MKPVNRLTQQKKLPRELKKYTASWSIIRLATFSTVALSLSLSVDAAIYFDTGGTGTIASSAAESCDARARNERRYYSSEVRGNFCYVTVTLFRGGLETYFAGSIREIYDDECPASIPNEHSDGICYVEPEVPIDLDLVLSLKQSNSCSIDNPVDGNPIVIANGNKVQVEVDYQSQSPFGLNFIRYYNSSAQDTDTVIGKKWSHNLNHRIVNIDVTKTIVYRGDGRAFIYNFDGSEWLGDADISDKLVEIKDSSDTRIGWEYTASDDSIETYNILGQLTSITPRTGQSKVLSYDIASADGGDDNDLTLDKVTSFNADTILFSYDSSNRISSITDPEGHIYSYSYDGFGNLASVSYPDTARGYSYEDANFPNHLTGVTDEAGVRFATWNYDNDGRAISSEHANEVDKTTFDFSIAGQVTVTNPLGKSTTYHFTTLYDVKKVTRVEGHASLNCAAANKYYTYDDNGYLASKTDWQGNVTTYIHDDKGLELSRTEVAGTPEARTITTQWHPNFRLPIKITTPTSITEFVYDANGNLTSRTESPAS